MNVNIKQSSEQFAEHFVYIYYPVKFYINNISQRNSNE